MLIANTTTTPGRARVTLLSDSGATYRRDYDLPAKSRTNVPIGHDFALTLTRFAIVVESLGVPPVPIVVERATYASPGGVTWAQRRQRARGAAAVNQGSGTPYFAA